MEGGWEEGRCSQRGVSRQSSPCLPPSLHPQAASPLFIPLQGNYLILIKMSQGIHKYIHSQLQEFHSARGALLLSALLGLGHTFPASPDMEWCPHGCPGYPSSLHPKFL